MFKKSTFLSLVNAYANSEPALSVIQRSMNALGEYVNSVYTMELKMPILRFRLEPEEFRNAIMELDRARHNAHEAAIDACRILNRICTQVGLENLYTGSLEERLEVADFCMSVVSTLFEDRVGVRKSLQDWVDAVEKMA